MLLGGFMQVLSSGLWLEMVQIGPQLQWLEQDYAESKAEGVTWQACRGCKGETVA